MPQHRAGLIVSGLAVLCLAQLLGEAFVRLLDIPVPGAVAGLVMLSGVLLWSGHIPHGTR